tara:strand:+ start:6786 stop:6986 length:201 start_codon:yes stop_codon:yes gene_type:complete
MTIKQLKTKVKKRLRKYLREECGNRNSFLSDGELDVIVEEIAHFVRSEVDTHRDEIRKSIDPIAMD